MLLDFMYFSSDQLINEEDFFRGTVNYSQNGDRKCFLQSLNKTDYCQRTILWFHMVTSRKFSKISLQIY